MLADGLCDLQDIFQIGAAVFVRRRAHGDEHDFGTLDRSRGVGGELEPAGRVVGLDHWFEAGLVDRDDAMVQSLDLGGIDVHAHNIMADLGQAGARDQPDIAGTKNRDAHGTLPVLDTMS